MLLPDDDVCAVAGVNDGVVVLAGLREDFRFGTGLAAQRDKPDMGQGSGRAPTS